MVDGQLHSYFACEILWYETLLSLANNLIFCLFYLLAVFGCLVGRPALTTKVRGIRRLSRRGDRELCPRWEAFVASAARRRKARAGRRKGRQLAKRGATAKR